MGAGEGAVPTALGAVWRLASSRQGRSDSTLTPQATVEAWRGSRGLHWGGLCTLAVALEGRGNDFAGNGHGGHGVAEEGGRGGGQSAR